MSARALRARRGISYCRHAKVSKEQDIPLQVSDPLLAHREDNVGEVGQLLLEVELKVLWRGSACARTLPVTHLSAQVPGPLGNHGVGRTQLPLQCVEQTCAGGPGLEVDCLAVETVVLRRRRAVAGHGMHSRLHRGLSASEPFSLDRERCTHEHDLVRLEKEGRLLLRGELTLPFDESFCLFRNDLEYRSESRHLV